jgi:hypothetical protein
MGVVTEENKKLNGAETEIQTKIKLLKDIQNKRETRIGDKKRKIKEKERRL